MIQGDSRHPSHNQGQQRHNRRGALFLVPTLRATPGSMRLSRLYQRNRTVLVFHPDPIQSFNHHSLDGAVAFYIIMLSKNRSVFPYITFCRIFIGDRFRYE